jgi:hypothetical protein
VNRKVNSEAICTVIPSVHREHKSQLIYTVNPVSVTGGHKWEKGSKESLEANHHWKNESLREKM